MRRIYHKKLATGIFATVFFSLLIVGVVYFSVFGIERVVYAESNANTVTWGDVLGTNINMTDASSVAWKTWHQPNCQPSNAIVEDYTTRKQHDICYTGSKYAQLATYQQSSDGPALYALKRSDDEVFHRIETLSFDPSNLVLLSNDTLLGASQEGGDALSMYLLRNFHTKVTKVPVQTGIDTFNNVYTLDTISKIKLRDSTGRSFPARSIAVSGNGEHAAVQILGRGLAHVNLRNLGVTLVSSSSNNGSDVRLSVSNDGNTIAVTGNGSTLQRIYTDIDKCGVHDFSMALTGRKICHQLDLTDKISNLLLNGTVFNPTFSDDGNTLSAFLWNNSEQRSRKLIITPNFNRYRLEYLALGDSYSSGEGDVEMDSGGKRYYLPGTDSHPEQCHISSRSYPFLLRDMWNIADDRMKSVACSGAQVMPDYNGRFESYRGQHNRLGNNSNNFTKQQALIHFTPGHIPQLEFVKEYQPKLVTLTGGGNDIGFANIIEYCATPEFANFIPLINSDCGYANKDSELEKMLYRTIDTQYTYNKKLIRDMQSESPASRIVLIGYPSFITDKSWLPCAPNSGALTTSEIRMINKMVDYANSMLRRVAHDTGIDYVGIANSLEGGRICEGSEYMTGVWKNLSGRAFSSEQFHPNAEGHKRMAAIIDREIPGNIVPEAGDYEPNETTAAIKTVLMSNEGIVRAEGLDLRIGPGLLKSYSFVTVTTYSTPREIGHLQATSDGSIVTTLPLDKVETGRHVLVVDGVDALDNPIQLFQFIEVRASKDDADGDGVSDKDDVCQYIAEWYDETTGKNMCSPEDISQPNTQSGMLPLSARRNILRVTSPVAKPETGEAAFINSIENSSSGLSDRVAIGPRSTDRAVQIQGGRLAGITGGIIVILVAIGGFCAYRQRKQK